MRKDIFSSMKEQMIPEPYVVASLKYELSKKKKGSVYLRVFRWGSAAAAALLASVLVLNLTMPAYAERLPVVGGALESLNELGSSARESGKTPDFLIKGETEKKDYSVKITNAQCNGLDLTFKIEISDLSGNIAPEAECLVLADTTLQAEGMYLYPIDENPRLLKVGDGEFCGWATFNSSAIASMLKSGESVSCLLFCEGLYAYVEGATYEDTVSKYTYDFHEATEFSASADLSGLSVEYLGLEMYGINLEHKMVSKDRTDIVFTVDENVEYPSNFSVYTDNMAPRVITVSRSAENEGAYVYNATFAKGGKDAEISEGVALDDLFSENESFYEDLRGEDIIMYSHATGECYVFELESESEGEK